MTVIGKTFGKDEKKEAGEAILEAAAGLHGVKNASKIGEYKGFDMTLTYSFVTQKVTASLKGSEGGGVTHQAELGASPTGNITRIDNMLEKIPEQLQFAKTYVEDLHKQLEDAKKELGRPFPQEQELKEKSARLAELDILLNMDGREEPQQENETALAEEGNISVTEDIPVPESDCEQEVPAAAVQISEQKNAEREISPEFEIGQRVIFHPDGGDVKVSGWVLSIEEHTVTILAGAKKIPIYKDKGVFEPVRNPVTASININAAGRESDVFER
jgi:hypothetical protein